MWLLIKSLVEGWRVQIHVVIAVAVTITFTVSAAAAAVGRSRKKEKQLSSITASSYNTYIVSYWSTVLLLHQFLVHVALMYATSRAKRNEAGNEVVLEVLIDAYNTGTMTLYTHVYYLVKLNWSLQTNRVDNGTNISLGL